jgi:hypothetical protein
MIKKKILRIAIHIALLLLVMLYGVLVGKFQFPPYSIIETGYNILMPKEYTEIPKEYIETDVEALISITLSGDLSERRKTLINFLWGRPELPLSLPSAIMKSWKDSRYEDIRSLQRIDKLVISMEFDLDSIVYHFIPKNPNNKVVLYHQGHRGDFVHSKEQIGQFIDHGYAVVAFCMPLLGLNNQPSIDVPRIGKLKIASHDHMKFLSPENGHPIKYFIEPIVIALNYLEKNFDYSLISMVGISGGGWTTTLAAAVDTKISRSFPVAGSYPIYLRSNSPRDWGDYEQNNPDLYKNVNYLELYILGSAGKNRRQTQIINQFDSCCFAGIKWETYKDAVISRLHQLGMGEFDLFMDDSNHEHKISNVSMNRILEEIATH